MRLLFALFVAAGLAACAHPAQKPEVPLDQKWVEDTATQHNHEVLACYLDQLKSKPGLNGEIGLWIEIAPDGSGVAPKIVRHLEHDFDGCVAARAKDWKYPWVHGEAAAVEYVFQVHPSVDGQPLSEFHVQPFQDRFHVLSTIDNHREEWQACSGAKHHHGKVELEWVIGDKGEVTKPHVKESLGRAIDICVLNQLKSWTFPEPPRELVAKVQFPFYL